MTHMTNIKLITNPTDIKKKSKRMAHKRLTIVPVGGWFPGGPVGPDAPAPQPLTVHKGDCILGLHLWKHMLSFPVTKCSEIY